jgi:octaheme c-type cytochrome (tetrathionate reductase family)
MTVRLRRFFLLSLSSALTLFFAPFAGMAAEPGAKTSTADHSKFEELQQEFATGPDVTRACLGCHTEAAKQLHKTTHWTWEFNHEKTGQQLGKKYVVNSFCGSVTANYPRCTSCHIGYGWQDASFDFTSEEAVDCLVCHDTTGTYKKFPTDAGHPPYEDKKFGGKKLFNAVDLTKVAQNVGKTTRENCGSCHFTGGGGDAVKHGDIDTSLTKPSKALDVHMDAEGLNYSCATCHTFTNHDPAGSRYDAQAKDTTGIAVPGKKETRATCESCHGTEPHPTDVNNKLNEHVDTVACQTCHIPAFARGGKATKTWWDWSTAGKLKDDGKPVVKKDDNGYVTYHGKKGDFGWEENVQPEYYWFDGTVRYSLLGDKLKPVDGVVEINQLAGDYGDPNARIWPFKVMAGKQPYDTVNNSLLVSHLFGKDEAAFWKSFDWDKALRAGMAEAKAVGQTDMEYSGEFDFIETRMYWPITHMVAPKEDSLACNDCHSKDGRMANLTGFYMPGRDSNPWIDQIGWLIVLATLAGVFVHGLMRLFFLRNKGGRD